MRQPSPRPASRFVRLARAANAHRWRTFFAWILALVAVQAIAAGVGTKEISNLRLPGTESQRAYDLLAEHFPAAKGDTDQLVFRSRRGALTDQASRTAIERALEDVARNPVVAGVQSPFAAGGQLTEDRRIAVAPVTYTESVNELEVEELEAVQATAFRARSAALQVEHGGLGAQTVRFENAESGSELVGVVAAAVVLFITFGSLVAMGLPLISALLALFTTLGLIALISQVVDTPDFAAQLASLIGLGVGIDYALFVVTRFRAEVRAGMDRDRAIELALDTAGRTVVVAAVTVVIALLGLLLLGLSFMHGVALGAASAVLATMFAALTVLPAMIGGSGGFFDGVLTEFDRRGGIRAWGTRRRFALPFRALRARRAARRETKRAEGAGWGRWSRAVQRRPWAAAAVAIAVLVGLTLPAVGMRLGSSDAGVDPPGTTTRAAYDTIAEGFGAGTNGSFLFVAELADRGDEEAADGVAAALRRAGDFVSVSPPALSPDGAVATISAFPRTGPQDEATDATLDRVRDEVVPGVEERTGATVEVGGLTASNDDFSSVVAGKLPLFVGVVVLLSALLLLVVFRSVVIPVKAALMNLLSIGAALGLVTLIFQEGVGAGLVGVSTGPIEAFVPVLMFAIVFGLSMDYEVFLLSRIHEEWELTGDASESVAHGLQATGKVITAAASIMILVFAGFALGDDRVIKLFGIGLASAVLLDAIVIRCLLVPAIMELLGRRAWYAPAWLERRLPRVAIEAADDRGREESRMPETV